MTPERPARSSRTWRITAVTIAAMALVLAVVWAGSAQLAYRASFSAGRALDKREECARMAARIDPWSRRYRVRSRWLAGDRAIETGDYLRAVVLLGEAYRDDVGNNELLADFRRAQDALSLETNRKAHLQHGHEGPGGTLAPGDVEH